MFLLESSLIAGVISGLIFALAGIGLIVIYRVSGYVSFAQGDIAAVALYVGLILHTAGVPYALMALVVVLVGALVGWAVGRFLVIPFERFGILPAAIATVGVGTAIQGGGNLVFGGESHAFPTLGEGTAMTLLSVQLSVADVFSFGVCAFVVVVMTVGFRRTRMGIAMRAVHDNPAAARTLGLRADALKRKSWLIAGALAGLCGLFIVPVYSLTPTSVNSILMFGFCAIVVGGLDSIVGAVVAGILIGVASNLTAAFLSPDLVTTALFLCLTAVLLLRPQGLFGHRSVVRV